MFHFNSMGALLQSVVNATCHFAGTTSCLYWLEHHAVQVALGGCSSDMEELHSFLSWVHQEEHGLAISQKLQEAVERQIHERVRKFGEDDWRTERLAFLHSYMFGDATTVVEEAKQTSISELQIDGMVQLLAHSGPLPTQTQLHLLWNVQNYLHRMKHLTDLLELLFSAILQNAARLPTLVLLGVGVFYINVGKHEKALEVLHRALANDGVSNNSWDLHIRTAIGDTLLGLDRLTEADEWICRLLKDYNVLSETSYNYLASVKFSTISCANNGMRSQTLLENLSNLGFVWWNRNKYPEAEEIFRLTVEGSRKELGREHPDTLEWMYYLGRVLCDEEKYSQAEEILHLTVESERKVLGGEHEHTLESMHSLGCVLYYQGESAKAEEIFRLTIDGRKKGLGEEDEQTLNSLYYLGCVLCSQRKYLEAEEILRLATDGQKKALGEEDKQTLGSMHCLGCVLCHQSKYAEAEKILRLTVQLEKKELGEEDEPTLESMQFLGCALYSLRRQKWAEAEEILRLTTEGRRKVLGEDHSLTLESMHILGCVLYSQHGQKCAEAEEIFRLTIEGSEKVLGKEHKRTRDSLYCLHQFRAMPSGYHPYCKVEFAPSDSDLLDWSYSELCDWSDSDNPTTIATS